MKKTELHPSWHLDFNPFPPMTTGGPLLQGTAIPDRWKEDLHREIDLLAQSSGAKALAVVGAYGTGKTYLLQWFEHIVLPAQQIQPFMFENPGVTFYDLANRLLRRIGRYNLAKMLWEILYRPDTQSGQRLLTLDFPSWLTLIRSRREYDAAVRELTQEIVDLDLTSDTEIAHRFSRVIADTKDRPYFEYRDFVPRSATSIVVEKEEAHFFCTLIRVLVRCFETHGIAFLLDEFEDVSLGRRLSRKQASDYVSTLRRLLDTASTEDFWLILSSTPEGIEGTRQLEPSLMERFSGTYEIRPLSIEEAHEVVVQRLAHGRNGCNKGMWPFEDDAIACLAPTTYSRPRRLIKVFWRGLAMASAEHSPSPISNDLLRKAEQYHYPAA